MALTVGQTAGDGSTFTGAVTQTAGTLRGTGTITGLLTLSGGTLAPGDATNVGTLTTNAQPTLSGGTFSVNLAALGTGNYGQLNVTAAGGLNLGAGNPISLTVTPYGGATDGPFTIIQTASGLPVSNFSATSPRTIWPFLPTQRRERLTASITAVFLGNRATS